MSDNLCCITGVKLLNFSCWKLYADVFGCVKQRVMVTVFESKELNTLINFSFSNDNTSAGAYPSAGSNSIPNSLQNNNLNPVVHMYRFFEMFAQLDISLKDFQEFYFNYLQELVDLQNSIKIKINELTRESYEPIASILIEKANLIKTTFSKEPIFNFLCEEKYDAYLTRPNVTKAKDCFKENSVYGVLSAYKLFYVGCSRARKNLTILLNKAKITGDIELQKKKFTDLGFIIN